MIDEIIQNAHKAAGGEPINITIKSSKEEEYIKIEVSDTGPGIPIEILYRIFDKFFTTRESGKGGEGLYLIKKYIVNLKKGNIEVNTKTAGGKAYKLTYDIDGMDISENSARNETGSTFTIRIPFSVSTNKQVKPPDGIQDIEKTKEQIDASI